MSGFAAKYAQKEERVHLITHRPVEREPEYFFLLVNPLKENKLTQLLGRDGERINLTEFGEVLASGYGEPPKELIAEMEAKYNFEYTG